MITFRHTMRLDFGHYGGAIPCSLQWQEAYMDWRLKYGPTNHERLWLNQWLWRLFCLNIYTGE